MALAVYQGNVVNDSGDVMPAAQVSVLDAETGNPVTLKPNRDGSGTLSNPFNADEDGFFRFYAPAGRVDIVWSYGGDERRFNDVILLDAPGVRSVVAGTNVTVDNTDPTNPVVSASGGGGGGAAWELLLRPIDNEPPLSNYATLDTRNTRPCLDFDATTQEAAIFSAVLPHGYGNGGLLVKLYIAMTAATTGTVGWDLAIERAAAGADNVGSDSFASAVTVSAVTVPGTPGIIVEMEVELDHDDNLDGLQAGEAFRLRLRRDVANDTATGDAELFLISVREA